MARLYAIDAMSVGHWLYHAHPKDEKGNELPLAQATAGWFANFCEAMAPSYVAVCFDGRNNWREKLYAEYKSTRKAKPDDEDKKIQLSSLRPAWKSWGVPTLEYETFEADDTIASLCNVHASPECEVIVISSDKDLMQLVGPYVRQYDPRPNKAGECKFYDEAAVIEKMSVPPHRVADLLAIMGDTVDDVPGIAGWGEVAAKNAVKQTKSMTELIRKAVAGELKHINVNKQRREKPEQKIVPFAEQLEELELSRKLVALRYDVPVPAELDAFALPKAEAA